VQARDADNRAATALPPPSTQGPDLAKALRIALDANDPMYDACDSLTPDRHTAVLRAATTLATARQRMLPPIP
jgi:hypothetical protein